MVKCSRCKTKEAVPKKSRCLDCLEYARNWQKNKTANRRLHNLCITCGAPTTGLSRCIKCSEHKSEAYFEKKCISNSTPELVQV